MAKKSEIVEEFDALLSEAPLDFMGTGCSKSAAREESLWNERVESFRRSLETLSHASRCGCEKPS